VNPPFGPKVGYLSFGRWTREMELAIRETGAQLGSRIEGAYTFASRFRGLMLKPPLPDGHGLHIAPCGSVHAFFMRGAIDVLFLGADGTIVGILHELQPRKLGWAPKGTWSVVELPPGTLRRNRVMVGQTAVFRQLDLA
jgi:uncharacterized protein